ncbi:hypothetical protein B9Z19DRAFT_307467 [Tuber borchii]|uniref:Uncharacterized protein n=1 Tax=Tuber borchii TaxID=42251 RepID=A0A2T6ZK11_TUBBO|nr:hypothetical protein B9Z19DRAFT_307467 [Tuber borchii]
MQASNCSHEFTTPYRHHLHSNHTLTWEYQTRSYQENSPPIKPEKNMQKSGPAKIREGANQVSHLQRPSSRKPSHEGPIWKMLVQGAEKEPPVSPYSRTVRRKPTNPPLLAACCSPPPALISHPKFTESKKGSRREKNKTLLRQVIYHIRSNPLNSRSGEKPPTTRNPRTPTTIGSIPHIINHFPPSESLPVANLKHVNHRVFYGAQR